MVDCPCLIPAKWRSSSTTLTVAYDQKPAIWDIDLEVPQGALMAIVGPNGAGKKHLDQSGAELDPAGGWLGALSWRNPTQRRDAWSVYVPTARQRRLGLPHLGAGMSSTMGAVMASWAGCGDRARHERAKALAALETGSVCSTAPGAADQPAFWRAAAARFPGAGIVVQDAQIYFMGRALRRGRCHHRSRHRQ